MNHLATLADSHTPDLIAAAGNRAAYRFLEFIHRTDPQPTHPPGLRAGLGATLARGAGVLFEPLPVSGHMAVVDVLPRLVRKVPWHTGRHVRGASGCLPKAAGPLGLNPRAVHTNERLRYFGWRLDCLFTRRAHASSEPEGCTNPENADSLGSGHTQHS